MNTSKADNRRSNLVPEENNPPAGYASFTFYGIHTHKFIDWTNKTAKGPAALLPEGKAEAALQCEIEVPSGLWAAVRGGRCLPGHRNAYFQCDPMYNMTIGEHDAKIASVPLMFSISFCIYHLH